MGAGSLFLVLDQVGFWTHDNYVQNLWKIISTKFLTPKFNENNFIFLFDKFQCDFYYSPRSAIKVLLLI